MAIPTSYTEETLKAYMVTALGVAAAQLKITVDDLDDAVDDTLQAYGVLTIAQASDVLKLRAIAAFVVWKFADLQAGMPLGVNDQTPVAARKVLQETVRNQAKLAGAKAMAHGLSTFNIRVTFPSLPNEISDDL